MQAPAFWQHDGVAARLFSPLSAITAAVTARRVARPGTDVGVPVICIGNATIGGAGKTPVALDVAARLQVRGRRVAFLTRGHGGRSRGVVPVDPARHDADAVGDEPLLLAALAPVFVAADRLAGARAAMAAGAQMLVMDDGLQNPGLVKTLSLLVIDGGAGFGNGRVLPAGPLREPVCAAAARCRAAVLIGADTAGARARLPPGLAVKRARMDTEVAPGQRVVAFAGIGRPEKFFAGLREAGAEVLETHGFADHHRFSEAELRALLHRSETCNARLITTAKDFVRLPMSLRAIVLVAPVRLQWLDPIDDLLDLLT